jgi:membrane protease YdiL (CAAX protease family)
MTCEGLVIIFFAALMLAYAYLKTGQLWLSIGLHAGWDFFVVVVFFATPINGLKLFSLIDISASSWTPPLLFYSVDCLTLAFCLVLIRSYATARKRKMCACGSA